jgi:hypothetical protein
VEGVFGFPSLSPFLSMVALLDAAGREGIQNGELKPGE